MEIKLIGIRHHGPGSARATLQVLTDAEPDCLLVEAPADAEGLIASIGDAGLDPPVAMLLYNPKDFQQAIYLPFAAFSPEWQAMRFALQQEIPICFMDLPAGMLFSAEEEPPQLQLPLEPIPEQQAPGWVDDPLSAIAQLAGFTDSERWWEATFETGGHDPNTMKILADMMRAMREPGGRRESAETLRREAHMRLRLHQAVKDGYRRIAVVCGAWHLPALEQWRQIKPSADRALLKGRKKIKIEATWTPWSYDRLSLQSGYQAGVLAPAWYELLFSGRPDIVSRWMVKVARLLRSEAFDASSARVIDAVSLAQTLATLRGLRSPGIEELKEAALSAFCEGSEERLALVERRLIFGDVVGKVPAHLPKAPLQSDLESQIRSARLSREWKSTEPVTKKLDLRVDANLLASRLLHRLSLLEVPWGILREGSTESQGSFSESWRLRWKPDLALRVLEASMWGRTVEEAATNRLRNRAKTAHDLPALIALIEIGLKAQLETALPDLLQQLQKLAAQTREVAHFLEALPPLVNILRYGDVRRTAAAPVEELAGQLVERACIGLPAASSGIQEEPAAVLFEQVRNAHQVIPLLPETSWQDDWLKALETLSIQERVHPLLQGGATRMLFDKERLNLDTTASLLAYGLSGGQSPYEAVQWLEGFLHGSGLLLVFHPDLWTIIDEWVTELPLERFQEILPLLRRSFARFSQAERTKMLQIAIYGFRGSSIEDDLPDPDRAKKVWPTLRLLIGGN